MNPLKALWGRLTGGTALTPQAFDLGKNGRRLSAIPNTIVALNTLILQYGWSAVARSRYLCINNPYTVAAKEVFVSALTGTGIRPSTLGETPDVKEKVHEDWADWCSYADIDGLTDLYGLQGMAASEIFEAGEAFLTFVTPQVRSINDDVPLKLRMIPAEMLPYENFSTQPVGAAGNYIQLGIEFSPDGERVAYHFLKYNPTDVTKVDRVYERVRIPASEVMHVFKPIRVGQVRGIPHTLAALVSSAMLDLYDDAELERKRVAALFAAFVTKQPSEDGDGPLGKAVPLSGGSMPVSTSADPQGFKLQPGLVVDLLPGEDVAFSEPADVGSSYDPFQYRMLCRMAAGFGVPYASMSGDLKAANYGSIRAGLVQFRRRIEMMQWGTMIHLLARPIWLRWLRVYTLAGLSPWTPSDYVKNRRAHERVKWLCPRWDWVDPMKDAQAEKLMVDNGFKSRWDTVEESGYDPAETDSRIKEAQDSEDDNELRLHRFTSGAAAAADITNDPAGAGSGADPAPADPAPKPKVKKGKTNAQA